MNISRKTKLSLFLFVIGIASAIFLILNPDEPYEKYRDIKGSQESAIVIERLALKYNHSTEKLIRKSFNLSTDKKEKSILAGLHWLLGFIDKEENFQSVFTDFVILVAEMARTDERPLQKAVAHQLLLESLTRGATQLAILFPADNDGMWDFLGILQIVYASEQHRLGYSSFYQSHFINSDKAAYNSGGLAFEEAVQKINYEVIGDYLIDTSFLHYFLKKYPDNTLVLPPDIFEEYLHQFNQFKYNFNLAYNSDAFSDLAYLATHVVLVLTNYGEYPIDSSNTTSKVARYLNNTYSLVRQDLGDLDLFAEYLQCIKILGQSGDPRIAEAEQFLLSLQRTDGSWGSEEDFKQEPYSQFHPTWAVLTGLNH